MFNVGDRIRVYKTNWGPKKPFIGHEYIISEIRCGKDVATTYILSRPINGDSPTGACSHVWYDSELDLVRTAASELAKFDNKVLLNSIYGKPNDVISAMLEAGNFAKYIENDVKRTEEMWSMFFSNNLIPKIKNVIFNDPATIVFWSDGTKTVVKCQDDDWYDPEKGLAMAISKKALGNKGNYCNAIKKWLPKEEPDINWFEITKDAAHAINDGLVMGISAPTIPELANKCKDLADKLRTKRKKSAVQKAYDLAIEIRDEAKNNNKSLNHYDIDAVIGYLGEALED